MTLLNGKVAIVSRRSRPWEARRWLWDAVVEAV